MLLFKADITMKEWVENVIELDTDVKDSKKYKIESI